MATLAKQERLRISERTKAGLQRAIRAGKTLGRPRLDLNVEKLKRLRAHGLSLRQIAAQEQLTLTTVARVLREAAY
jgi:DNA invertase Pin-like site-specific DNA recombinase